MADITGAVNGTKSIFQIDTGGGFVNICGESSHSLTLNNEFIDVTNKCSGEKRTLLPGEGQQSIDVSVDALYSDDAALDFLTARAFDKAEFPAQQVLGAEVIGMTMMCQNLSDTADLNTAASRSFSLQSTGEFTRT